MGTLLVLIGGLIGAGSGFKKSFVSCWILLINFSFSVYISVFLAPLAVTFLEIPGLTAGYKNAIAVAGIFLIVNFILQKITEQIIPNPDINYNLPPFAKIFSIAAGFLSGLMIVGILMYCFMQTPFVSGLSQKKELRATARNTMMGVVYTLNVFSFQSLSPEAEKELQSIRLIPKKKTVSSGAQDEDDPQEQSKPAENKTADESVKKDSAVSSDNQQGKEDRNAQTKPSKKSKKKNPAASSDNQPKKTAENKKTD